MSAALRVVAMTAAAHVATPHDELLSFLERLLGWDNPRVVELAFRSLELAAEHWADLVLCGTGDLVPIAQALHRRALGTERPIVVCDPRRGNTPASVRSPANRASGLAALATAAGGSLCVRARRLPRDFRALVARLRGTDDVQFVVCADERAAENGSCNPPGTEAVTKSAAPSIFASGAFAARISAALQHGHDLSMDRRQPSGSTAT